MICLIQMLKKVILEIIHEVLLKGFLGIVMAFVDEIVWVILDIVIRVVAIMPFGGEELIFPSYEDGVDLIWGTLNEFSDFLRFPRVNE